MQRALFIALDEWADGDAPPPSRVPRLSDGTLVPPLPQSGVGLPEHPGRHLYRSQDDALSARLRAEFLHTGIATINPPVVTPPYQDNPANGPIYPSFVPKTDSDGNDIAGVRLPDVTVPLATYTGWALRVGRAGQRRLRGRGPVHPVREDARPSARRRGDPRPSVEERYPSFGQYYSEVIRAIDGLVKDRLMLCEDADSEQARLLQAGLNAGVPEPRGNLPPQTTPPLCQQPR